MFDALERKIDEIRAQPEHIRVRYMWGAMAISMAFIIVIWLMSIRINFVNMRNDEKSQAVVENFQQQVQDMSTATDQLKQQTDGVSIQDLITTPQEQPTSTPSR